jgi:predicted Zn-dependent protease
VDARLRDEPGAARRHLEALWEKHPGDAEVAQRLAPLLLRLDREGGPGMARRLLDTALEKNPQRGDLRLLLARVLSQLDLPAEALATLRATPRRSTHRDEIDAYRVTLERSADLGSQD